MHVIFRPLIIVLLFPLLSSGCSNSHKESTLAADQQAQAVALASAEVPPNGVPTDWACKETLTPVSAEAIAQFCSDHPKNDPDSGEYPRGKPYVASTRPGTLLNLEQKNAFDLEFGQFMNDGDYAKPITEQGLGWIRDVNWRLTGPIVGELCSDLDTSGNVTDCGVDIRQGYIDPNDYESYGSHPAVRIYYSPEVIDWLCDGRQGAIADNGVVIKEMVGLDKLAVKVDEQGCLTIDEDPKAAFYATFFRDNNTAHDGWYWIGNALGGNPPIYGASAATTHDFGTPTPTKPDPAWYPTGTSFPSKGAPVPNVVYPGNLYGAYCINCHASAETNLTYASFDNILSSGIQYKFYPKPHDRQLTPMSDAGSIHGLEDLVTPSQAHRAPYAFPLAAPNQDFLDFYNQIPPVSFSQVWDLRLPAETFDHAFASADGPDKFLSSDQCIGCHDATNSNSGKANMLFDDPGGKYDYVNLSPYATWRVSPMGLAGRDPIFFSQLQSETNNLPPALSECIENTCLHCHGVMGQRQLAIDTGPGEKCKDIFPVPPPDGVPFGEPFRLSMVSEYQEAGTTSHAKYGGLARDGISCAVCHHIADDPTLGTEPNYTGNFVTGSATKLIGPYEDNTIVPKPMEHAIGVTPEHGKQIATSEVCTTCHNILLPVIDKTGKILGASYEQTTGLEWQNSVFAQPGTFQSCQDCHMRTRFNGQDLKSKIANIESSDNAPTTERLKDTDITLTEREHFPRHTLAGLNVFINEMFQQFPLVLGLRQTDFMTASKVKPALIHGRDAILEIAEQETADLTIDSLEKTPDGKLKALITVTNKAGHFLPSGVGFRRAFLDFRIKDQKGTDLWASGSTNDLGVIIDFSTRQPLASELPIANPKAYQPHYPQITEPNQVQIYEEKITDSDGNFTTSFLRRITDVKDNRLRPKGYDPAFYTAHFSSPYIHKLAETHGEAANDPYYTNPTLTGADQVEYLVSLAPAVLNAVDHVEISLYNQSIPPGYLQQRFRDANRGAKKQSEIQRLYYLTSHLNVATQDAKSKKFIEQWKLALACTTKSLTGREKDCVR